jgi:glycosyltransferase involved in cell wall biosynthesis
MYRNHTVAVVLPAYNEASHVGPTMASLPSFVDRIYVVDDASTDDTWTEIRRHAAALNGDVDGDHDRVVTVRHESNRGAGGALKTGYRRALADRLDIVVTMDADGQMDPGELDRLLDPLVEDRADYAKGDRLSRPDDRAGMPRYRLLGNAVLTLLTRVASGYWRTSDPQNGYTAVTREALAAVNVEALYDYYGYCNEMLVRLNAAGMRVADVPMPARYGDEDSHISLSAYVPKVSVILLSSFLWRCRTKYLEDGLHPVAAYYLAAMGAGALGLVSVLLAEVSETLGSALVLLAAGALMTAVGLDYQESRPLEVTTE